MTKKVEAARDTQRATPPEGEARRWAAAKAVLDKEVVMVDKMQDNIKELEMMAEHATQDAQEAREVAHVESMPPDMRENVEAFHNLLTDKAEQTAAFYRETARRLNQVMQGVNEAVRLTVEAFKPVMQSFTEHAEELREVSKMWRLLGPYIDAEIKEHPEIYGDDEHPDVGEDVPIEVLIAAAAKRARADGVDVPRLQAEDEMQRRNRISEAMDAHKSAAEAGALVEFRRLAILADKDIGFGIFTTAVLKVLPIDAKDLMIDPETGAIDLYDITQKYGELKDVKNVDSRFLLWLFSLAYNKYDLRETNSKNAIIPIYIPDALKRMEVDPRPTNKRIPIEGGAGTKLMRRPPDDPAKMRFEKFMEFVRPLVSVAAWFGEKGKRNLYQVVGFHNYDEQREFIYLSIPYMFALVEYAKIHATKHGAVVALFHANIMNSNPLAVEVANRIMMGVVLRGVSRTQQDTYTNPEPRKPIKTVETTTAPDGTKKRFERHYAPEQPEKTITRSKTDDNDVTTTVIINNPKPKIIEFSISFKSLIEDCPQFKKELEAIRTEQGPRERAILEAAKEAKLPPDRAQLLEARKADHKTDPQKYNHKLKEVLDGAINIILNRSDAPMYYADLQIGRAANRKTKEMQPYKAPTKSTVGDYLIIRHKGKNPNYVKPF